MRDLDDLIREARQLPAEDRERLLESLEDSMGDRGGARANALPTHPYATALRLAGTFHSEFEDVSSEKYKHLSRALLDEHQER